MILFLLLFCYLIGNMIQYKLLTEDKKINSVVVGFVFIISIFQLVTIPFMYFHTSFSMLYYVCVVVILCSLFGSVFFFCRKKMLIKMSLKSKSFFFWLALILIFVQCLIYILLWHADADDSFYIAQITTNLESNKLAAFDPSTGNPNFIFQSQYELVGYEVLLSILCKSFHINPAFFCHSILPVFLLIVYYILMYEICKKIDDVNQDKLFVILTCINLFSGYSAQSRGAFLLFRLWQGKAVLVNIVLPMLFLVFYEIFKQGNVNRLNIIMLIAVLYCGFFSNAVGIYLVPIMYAMYTITFFLYTLDFRMSCKLVIPIIFALPFVVLKYIILKQDVVVDYITNTSDTPSYIDILKNLNGSGYMLLGWLGALIVIIILGDRFHRFFYGIYTAVCFLTVLNPLFREIIAGKITGSSVYWRLFWILQFSFIFLVAFCLLYKQFNKKILVYLLAVLVLCCCGKNILIRENYSVAQNKEKISNTTKVIVNEIDKEGDNYPNVLMPLEYAIETRQYTGKIILAWSRYSKMEYRLNGGEDSYNELLVKYNEIYETNNYVHINELVNELNVDYIVLNNTGCFDNLNGKFKQVYENKNIVIYKIQR